MKRMTQTCRGGNVSETVTNQLVPSERILVEHLKKEEEYVVLLFFLTFFILVTTIIILTVLDTIITMLKEITCTQSFGQPWSPRVA